MLKDTQASTHVAHLIGAVGKRALLCLPQGNGTPLATQCMGSWRAWTSSSEQG